MQRPVRIRYENVISFIKECELPYIPSKEKERNRPGSASSTDALRLRFRELDIT